MDGWNVGGEVGMLISIYPFFIPDTITIVTVQTKRPLLQDLFVLRGWGGSYEPPRRLPSHSHPFSWAGIVWLKQLWAGLNKQESPLHATVTVYRQQRARCKTKQLREMLHTFSTLPTMESTALSNCNGRRLHLSVRTNTSLCHSLTP